MKKVYVVKTDTFKENPVMAFDNYNDALHAAAAYKEDDDEKAKSLVRALPFCTTEPAHFDIKDLSSVIDMTVKSTLAVMYSIAEQGESDE